MSSNSRDKYRKDKNLYGKSRGGEDGKEENIATPEVHQWGEDGNPFFNLSNSDGVMTWGKDLWGSLKGLKNST